MRFREIWNKMRERGSLWMIGGLVLLHLLVNLINSGYGVGFNISGLRTVLGLVIMGLATGGFLALVDRETNSKMNIIKNMVNGVLVLVAAKLIEPLVMLLLRALGL